ncbi:MAG TPA: hypothetical protein VHY77_03050, partial [Acidimicrobiales bacterium]|nr:hypothetical protein [Acidimicrobiales bacterium]
AAQAVAHSLSGAVIMALGPTSDGARVTVVTGTQFAVNSPAPTPTSPSTTAPISAGSATGAASTTGAASATTGFLPPTTSTQALQAWDPRSCTAAGGPGS